MWPLEEISAVEITVPFFKKRIVQEHGGISEVTEQILFLFPKTTDLQAKSVNFVISSS